MPRLTALAPEQAAAAHTLLPGVVERHGDADRMARTIAHSPALLQGHIELSRAMKRSSVTRPRSEKISLSPCRSGSTGASAWPHTTWLAEPTAPPRSTSRWGDRARPSTPERLH